jgi:hypothetical protein
VALLAGVPPALEHDHPRWGPHARTPSPAKQGPQEAPAHYVPLLLGAPPRGLLLLLRLRLLPTASGVALRPAREW